jgi:hypothetical protein
MESKKRLHNSNAAFLLVIPGAILLGLSIGLMLDQPGFGLIAGIGAGLLLWGIIVVLKK